MSPYSGLNKTQSFYLELQCLQRLEANFTCECGACGDTGCTHFSRVIDTNVEEDHMIRMTHCGQSLVVPRARRNHHVPPLSDLNAQIACIVGNLKRAGIEHLDMLECD